jgi:hypothetical protein
MKMSIQTYVDEFETLPFDDRVNDLVSILWVLFGLHVIQYVMQTPLLLPNDKELDK